MKNKSIKELVDKIQSKEVSCEEVVSYYMKKIKEKEKHINAFISVQEESALKKARELDEKISKGESVGKLAGIPIAIKDNICTNGIITTCGSNMLKDFVSPYDATVIEKLKKEDAIIIGKTNLDEFGMGSSTENSAFKITKNPIDLSRVAGGSSGGSAAAVGCNMVPIALASDTGGSIRQPASFCGIVGMKPTYGLVSRFGLIAFASSLDQIGPLSMNVEDNAYLLNIISGEDYLDSTTVKNIEKKDYTKEINSEIKNMKIGVPIEFIEEGLNEEIRKVIFNNIKILRELGIDVEEFSLPSIKEGLSPYYIISSAEASSNLARFDSIRYGYRTKDYNSIEELVKKSRSEGFGKEVKRRIMLGTYVLSSGYYEDYYNKAQKFRDKLKKDFKEAFKRYDIIIGPVSPVLPFKIGERIEDPISMYLADIYTTIINLAQLPALSMPGGISKEGLPIGIQLIGDLFTEDKIYKVAYALEKKLNLSFKKEV